jgi:hypothetical protein
VKPKPAITSGFTFPDSVMMAVGIVRRLGGPAIEQAIRDAGSTAALRRVLGDVADRRGLGYEPEVLADAASWLWSQDEATLEEVFCRFVLRPIDRRALDADETVRRLAVQAEDEHTFLAALLAGPVACWRNVYGTPARAMRRTCAGFGDLRVHLIEVLDHATERWQLSSATFGLRDSEAVLIGWRPTITWHGDWVTAPVARALLGLFDRYPVLLAPLAERVAAHRELVLACEAQAWHPLTLPVLASAEELSDASGLAGRAWIHRYTPWEQMLKAAFPSARTIATAATIDASFRQLLVLVDGDEVIAVTRDEFTNASSRSGSAGRQLVARGWRSELTGYHLPSGGCVGAELSWS